jgi:hypothetical protein
MNYAQAQYSTDSGKSLILSHMLAGTHDKQDVRSAAQYLCKTLRVGNMRECTELVLAAIEFESARRSA